MRSEPEPEPSYVIGLPGGTQYALLASAIARVNAVVCAGAIRARTVESASHRLA
jgi:hypothetical protein